VRKLTNSEQNKIKLLTKNRVLFILIEPTETGLTKSIMDATGLVRHFLKNKNIHDYDLQSQGTENKIVIKSIIHTGFKTINSQASLYRPDTKNGDPRIWFYGLKNIANANDIIAIIYFDSSFQIFNLTQLDIEMLINSPIHNPLQDLIREINNTENEVAFELLAKLRSIASKGYVKSIVNADTGVGRTLETSLGIDMNSSKSPDYKGIELKSFRDDRGTRKGLFGKTPDWKLSKFKSRVEILDNFGYQGKNGDFRIYNTIRATGRNAQGLILRIEADKDWLIENSDNAKIGDFLVWELEVLKKVLNEKHKETFWISTDSKFIDGNEHFLYKEVEHTKNPLVNQFALLIEMGEITIDYNIKRKLDGSIEDAGCNFKIRPNSLNLLFPPSETYKLI